MTALPYDPERSFGFLLHDAARLLRRDFDRRTRAMGLSRAQWAALAHLRRREGCNQSTLAELLEVEPISVSRLIDRMEEAGWIERRADPADRRVRTIHLTRRSAQAFDSIKSVAGEVYEEALAGLAAEKRRILVEGLNTIIANLADGESCQAGRGEQKEENAA